MGEYKIELQHYGEAWVTWMVTVRVQFHGPGQGLGLGVRLGVRGG